VKGKLGAFCPSIEPADNEYRETACGMNRGAMAHIDSLIERFYEGTCNLRFHLSTIRTFVGKHILDWSLSGTAIPHRGLSENG